MKLSFKRAETLSITAFFLHVIFFFLLLWLANIGNSLALRIESWHFLGGTLLWFILFLQFRQRRLAQEEKLDAEQYQRLKREGKDTSVFEGTTIESSMHIAQRRLAWLEKYLLSIFAVLIAIYQVAMAGWLYSLIKGMETLPILASHNMILMVVSFLALFSIISFLISRYAVGMSQHEAWRPLRAGGSYLLSNAFVCFGLGVVLLLADWRYKGADLTAAYVILGIMVVIGIEIVLNLVLDAFSPRIKGRYRRAPYESRILGLFSEPGGVLKTAAHALDYQFGFKVSDTWFYKLLEKAIMPLVVLQLVILYLMTSLAVVEPGNVAVIERWGKPIYTDATEEKIKLFDAGLHLKMPWPADKLRMFPVEQLQTIKVGYKPFEKQEEYKPVLWTKAHWEEEYEFIVAVSNQSLMAELNLLTGTSDEDLEAIDGVTEDSTEGNDFDMLVIAVSIHYRISDVQEYGYGKDRCYLDSKALLEDICNRETLFLAANTDVQSLMGPGRYATMEDLREKMQAKVDAMKMGVQIEFVGLESVHPPIGVAQSFEDVVSAFQQKQAQVLDSQGYAEEVVAFAKADSSVRAAKAQAYALRRGEISNAESERFAQQRLAYEKGGDVYLQREYLKVLDEYLPSMRKYVLTSDKVNRWVYQFDLTENLQPDLFEGLNMSDQEN